MRAGQRRSHRRFHDLSNFSKRHLRKMPQQNHLTLLRRQLSDRPLQTIECLSPLHRIHRLTHDAIRNLAQRVGLARPRSTTFFHKTGALGGLRPTHAIANQIRSNPEQPCIKPPVMLILTDHPNDPDKELLKQIFRFGPTTRQAIEIPVQTCAILSDQRIERFRLPPLSSANHLDKFCYVHNARQHTKRTKQREIAGRHT